MRKFIFLDIDGVMATKFEEFNDSDKHNLFEEACVKNLESIIEKIPNIEIIISSSWRRTGNLEFIKKIFKNRNFKYYEKITGQTPKLNFKQNINSSVPRGIEIEIWLRENLPSNSQYKYVIIDDDTDMMLWQKDNFINTNSENGLTNEIALKIIEILEEK